MPDTRLSPRSTPVEIAAEILSMIPNCPRTLDGSPSAADRRQRWKEIEQHTDHLTALKMRMVGLFGEQRGWRRARRHFNAIKLARRGRGYALLDDWPHCYADHAYFYLKDRQPVGVVAHPYDISAEEPRGVHEWAAREGLKASFPDFPSWWYPGRTSLVLFERA